MTISTERRKIIDKVVKLLALAESSIFKEEADTAKNMATELMAKYQIAVTEVIKKEGVEFIKGEYVTSSNNPEAFNKNLVNAICYFNEVVMVQDNWKWVKGKQKAYYKLIGLQEDVEASLYMIDIILQQRKILYKAFHSERCKTYGKEVANKDYRTHRLWHNGFSKGVQYKLMFLKEKTNEKIQEWGLVPVSIRKQALDWYKNQTSIREVKYRGLDYSHKGFVAGTSVHLNKGVEKQDSIRQIA